MSAISRRALSLRELPIRGLGLCHGVAAAGIAFSSRLGLQVRYASTESSTPEPEAKRASQPAAKPATTGPDRSKLRPTMRVKGTKPEASGRGKERFNFNTTLTWDDEPDPEVRSQRLGKTSSVLELTLSASKLSSGDCCRGRALPRAADTRQDARARLYRRQLV
jgi:hypothetical protein